MTKSKTSFMVAAGASVVVVRDGKRKTIAAGSGTDFTDDEITSINKALPGALRKPVNESAVRAAVETEDEDDADAETETKAPAKKAAAKKPAAKKAPAKKAAPVQDDADDDDDADADDDADEDEDI